MIVNMFLNLRKADTWEVHVLSSSIFYNLSFILALVLIFFIN